MASFLRKLIGFTSLILLLQHSVSLAQTWTAGVPMNQIITPNFMVKDAAQLPGCFPGASVNFNFVLPSVGGVQYYLKVTSIDANSAYRMPTQDTLAVGDSIAVSSGSNTMSIYYFAASATSNFTADLYAVGTPTTAGQAYPCATVQMWISNLMICNEGLSAQVQASCTVMSGPTAVASTSLHEVHIVTPAASNHYQIELNNLTGTNSIQIVSATGQVVKQLQTREAALKLACNELADDMYVLKVSGDSGKYTTKFIVAH